jgi:uncharacterized membrane protein
MTILINDFFYKEKKLKILILIAGIGIRLFHLIYNRSLWMDEIYLCSGLLHMNYIDLATKTLDYGQKAPIGFLWAVKFAMNLFGNTEIVLRLIPFISGIASLLLFPKVCSYFLKPTGQIIAISIFAFAPAFIYHSVEIKQYSTECLASIFALYLYTRYSDKTDWKSKVFWALSGACLLWFSFSLIFVLAGMAIALTTTSLIHKNFKSLILNTLPFTVWLITFLINYFLFTAKTTETSWVTNWFKTYDYFMPFPPENIEQFKWFPRTLIQMFDYPLGMNLILNDQQKNMILKLLSIPWIPLIMLLMGIFAEFNKRNRTALVLILPFLLMFLASGIHLYPIRERFWLFISPIVILFIVLGFEYFEHRVRNKKIVWLIFFLLISGQVLQSIYYQFQPGKFYKHKKSFEREALTYVDHHFHKGDMVYNYWNNKPGYDVYNKINNYKYSVVQGKDHRLISCNLHSYNQKLRMEFQQFSGAKRLWVIYNTQFTTTIGDRIDFPLWYYKGSISPVENLQNQIGMERRLVNKIVYSDLTVCLFELIH